MMPVMSGWEVLREMARTPHLAALPVVVFTAAGNSLAGENTLAKPVLRKPIDIDLLLDMVGSYCAAGQEGEGAAVGPAPQTHRPRLGAVLRAAEPGHHQAIRPRVVHAVLGASKSRRRRS